MRIKKRSPLTLKLSTIMALAPFIVEEPKKVEESESDEKEIPLARPGIPPPQVPQVPLFFPLPSLTQLQPNNLPTSSFLEISVETHSRSKDE